MTSTCPAGHVSATEDYCDQCGAPIASAPAPAPTEILSEAEEVDTSTTAQAQPCPLCGTDRSGDDRFCEVCGHDFLSPPPAADAVWEVVVTADRRQFERAAPAGVAFPEAYVDRHLPLDRAELRIGRSGGRADAGAPEIDLSGRQEDPGVSRQHAVLTRIEDGSYAVRDLGSTNGTSVNDDATPIDAGAAVPLADGDRVRLGAWTTITVRKAQKS